MENNCAADLSTMAERHVTTGFRGFATKTVFEPERPDLHAHIAVNGLLA